MNISGEYHASVYKDLDTDTTIRNRAARAELPCSECGSDFGMCGGWTRKAVAIIEPSYQLYTCKWDDHELYEPCIQCNPNNVIHDEFTPLTPEQVQEWLARECQCPDCRHERGETYPMMNKQIVDMLTFRGDSTSLYAAGRIEELEAETERLLEQAQRAEAAMQEAVAREAVIRRFAQQFSDGVFEILRPCAGNTNIAVWKAHWNETASSQAGVALLERLAGLEAQVADLRGALQAALTPLEAAADALVPEARVTEAAALVEEALMAIREELG